MKTTTNNVVRLLLFLVALSVIGCDTVDSNTENQAPDVLPEEAFMLDVGFFAQNESIAGKNQEGFANFLSAAIRVGVATHVTHEILRLPVELTAVIQHVEPVIEGNAFVWAADTLVEGQRHAVELIAEQRSNAINWQMKITGVADDSGLVFEDFLLYEANTGLESNEGTFQVFYPVEGGSLHVMNGDYAVVDDSEHTLSFRIPSEVEEIGGAQATYHHEGDWLTLDMLTPDGNTHFIEWNTVTNEGSLTATDYNNGMKSCWNTQLLNADCTVS